MAYLDHPASTDRAEVDAVTGQDCVALAIVDRFDGSERFWRLENGSDARELGSAAGVCQEAEVADPAKALRKHVEQKAADELVGIERHHLGSVVGAIVLPTKADIAVLAGEQPAIGDRNAMGIAAEIGENLLWPAERTLGVDDPFDFAQGIEMTAEHRRVAEVCQIAKECELGVVERRLQVLQEQTSVQPRQNSDRQEKAGPATDPASIAGKAAARDDAMGMGMMRQGLTPGVENGDHAGLSSEMPGIDADEADRLGCRLEQDVVDDRLVLERDDGDGPRHREDDVEVSDWQQVGLPIGKPLGARQGLALRAVPVTTAVVGDANQAAVVALLNVPAERRSAARLDGGHDAALVR